MGLITALRFSLSATLTKAGIDLSTPNDPLSLSKLVELASGVASGQADLLWHDQRTLNASANEDLDLAGGLTDALGNVLTFVKLKLVLIIPAAGNTNAVRVTRPATTGCPIFLADGDGTDVLPDGMFLWVGPGAGITITPGTDDVINVANSTGGTSVTYKIVLIGTSA